ncbi:MAG: response regulator transcription factor [Polyangiaceae bacterium]
MTPEPHSRTVKPLRVLIVDDHPLMRAGLEKALAGEPLVQLVNAVGDGESALSEAERSAPDVVLMDVNLPGVDGVQATRRMREKNPNIVVLALTMHDEPHLVQAMLDAGAQGYLLKTEVGPAELVSALEQVSRGERVASPGAQRALRQREAAAVLSRREREVLALVADGLTNKEIGERLGVAARTVETYRLRLKQKLGLQGTAALTRWALDHGVLMRKR